MMPPFLADLIQPSPGQLKRRLGTFAVDLGLLENDPLAVRTALEGCVVVRAETLWHRMVIDYVALHEEFDPVPPGDTPPAYICELTKHFDGSVTRVWKKAP